MLIEEFVVHYLDAELSVPVAGAVPANPPDKFVTVERTGGSANNKIRTATLAVQAWAKTIDEAANLCAEVTYAMEAIATKDEISRCELNSSYNFTDTTTKHCRYQAVFDVVHYLI